MTLEELVAVLSANPEMALRVMLPNHSFVPAHFHVTEVGRVQKDFVDCGGTVRNSETCVLQVWVANDESHRITTKKLAKIIQQGIKLFGTQSIPLEVEYEHGLISQYPVQDAAVTADGVVLQLGTKHTACLAPDLCGIEFNVLSSCSTPGCC